LSDGSWIVTVNLEIVERVSSMEAKRVAITYPMRVVRMNISPDKNIWGLAVDGYPEGQRSKEIVVSKQIKDEGEGNNVNSREGEDEININTQEGVTE
jgi:hypothetical protein